MIQRLVKYKNQKKGFTLIELIVVIAIIAILAAILLPKYFGFTDDARKNACLSEAKNISGICQTYYASYGEMPAIHTGVLGSTTDPSTVTLTKATPPTVYKFEGVLTRTTSYTTKGDFTYIKNNGTVTANLWKATYDADGNLKVETYTVPAAD